MVVVKGLPCLPYFINYYYEIWTNVKFMITVLQPGSLGALVAATVMAQQQQQQQQVSASGIPSSCTSGVTSSTANTMSNASPLGVGIQGIGGIPGLGRSTMACSCHFSISWLQHSMQKYDHICICILLCIAFLLPNESLHALCVILTNKRLCIKVCKYIIIGHTSACCSVTLFWFEIPPTLNPIPKK